MTNSRVVAHKSWMVRCSPRALGFSQAIYGNVEITRMPEGIRIVESIEM